MKEPSAHFRRVTGLFRAAMATPGDPASSPGATRADLEAAERALGFEAPESYAWFQLELGGEGPLTVYGAHPGGGDIVKVNLDARHEGHPPLPTHLIAFSDNGGGDLLCFDTSARIDGEFRVVWWDHEKDEMQRPEPEARSFLHWLEAELEELASERPGSLADNLPEIYRQWMKNWFT